MVRITHFLNKVKKETLGAENPKFLLSNKKGDYFWLGNGAPESRYEGWFCNLGDGVFRIIESLAIEDAGEVLELQNKFTHFERRRKDLNETLYLSSSSHTFIYELSKEKRVNIFFDVRHSYDCKEGADYTVEKKGDMMIVEFENGIFLAIKGGEGHNTKESVERYYDYDKRRNSPPFSRTVYHGVTISGKRLVFSAARSKSEAVREANKLFVKNIVTNKEEEVDIQCVKTALSDLLVIDQPGIYAGLPWFFHFWPRDEAVALKAVLEIDRERGKEIFFRLLNDAMKKGPGGVINIDAAGWLFKRAEDILPLTNKKEKEMMSRGLKRHIEELLWSFTESDLAVNRNKETWMDSLDRSGARIEIQAMRLNIYRLASVLAKRRRERKLYKKMETHLRKKVRKIFFDGNNLYDGYYPHKNIVEKVIRPNIFIAAYIYPQLLTGKEWMNCFDNALEALWLPWGGIATIDKKNDNFHDTHTGENPGSYHQGDSWFYVNNLAAIVLFRLNKRKYTGYISKIMEASREEILSRGAVGAHGEVSSAKELKSEGCVSQAWSNAMYLEAKREMGKQLPRP